MAIRHVEYDVAADDLNVVRLDLGEDCGRVEATLVRGWSATCVAATCVAQPDGGNLERCMTSGADKRAAPISGDLNSFDLEPIRIVGDPGKFTVHQRGFADRALVISRTEVSSAAAMQRS